MHRVRMRAFCIAVVATLSLPAAAQVVSSFEVASVRRVVKQEGYTSISPSGAPHFTARNVTLSLLIQIAFGVDGDQVAGGPGWLNSELYDIAAKANSDAPLSYEQLRGPLQRLLQERFGLKVHRETREVPGYALVVAKGGSKLPITGEPGDEKGYVLRDAVQNRSASMATLAGMLTIPVGRPVVDETGLTGNYVISLKFAPMDTNDSGLPSLPSAMEEQLGLKLEPKKIRREILVVDAANKEPKED
ncbi:TIGR03435 family protein [Terriglobus albidus]|uniref:TIGR03435 family protein n=2 Tax=Terriglobus albidus TaxID=1592106 RepID=A0A5B9EDU1_9BACT|nr:TIGR03435 family protein [Terriglobus albidus]